MYNKLFTKILDSSVWLEPDATRIVWLTMLAAMDEDGFVPFASVANLAHRARVSIEAAEAAVKTLSGPDTINPGQDNEGRRIERVEGGWIVLKAPFYRELVSRVAAREANRARVARFRSKRNADVMPAITGNESVMESEADAGAYTESLPSVEIGAEAPARPTKRASKMVPKDWEPSASLLERIRTEEVDQCLKRGGTSVEMELECFRSWTFSTARTDWDRAAWNWLLKSCKQVMQQEARNGFGRQARR